MAIFKSSNPALSSGVFQNLPQAQSPVLPGNETQSMTVSGTVNKTGILLLIVMAAAWFTWDKFNSVADMAVAASLVKPFIIVGCLGGFIAALVIIFKKNWAPYLSPVYAALEGLALGAISAQIDRFFPGIALQAVLCTFGVCAVMLALYKARILRATPTFKKVICTATLGIMVVYLISFALSFFGKTPGFLFASSAIGIGFSVFVVAIAAFNLVLDFDFIEQGANAGAPKYMEWYGAFGLMVTLVWLYLEILRLLAKLNRR